MLQSGLGLLLKGYRQDLSSSNYACWKVCICLLITTRDSEKFCGTGNKVTIATFLG